MSDEQQSWRWEWRIFDTSLAGLEAKIGGVANVAPRISSEIYFLCGRDNLNLKLRQGVLDLKVLERTDGNGLELWKPRAKLAFPANSEDVSSFLEAIGKVVPGFACASHEDFVKRMGDALRMVQVEKARRNFTWDGCMAEFATITANGHTHQTFCIESEDRERLIAALGRLGLSPRENVNFPRGLKRDFDISPKAGKPKANTEIERKFLVDVAAWRPSGAGVEFRQGYLSSVKERIVRVRLAGARGCLTIKGLTAGASRSEFEYDIPVADAAALLETLCEKPVIAKTRHRETIGGKVWEIDVFHGDNEGLVVAEIELDSEGEAFEKPAWVTREVSSDPRYFNNNLLAHPYKEWSSA